MLQPNRKARVSVIAALLTTLPITALASSQLAIADGPFPASPLVAPQAPTQPGTPDGVSPTSHSRFIIGFRPAAVDAKKVDAAPAGANTLNLIEKKTKATVASTAEKFGAKVTRGVANAESTTTVTLSKSLNAAQAKQFMADIKKIDTVDYVEPDLIMKPTSAVNDTDYSKQWSLTAEAAGIKAENAWKYATGKDVTVAVVDTGIVKHPDLDNKVVPGYDFISEVNMSRDGNGRDANPQDEGDWMEAGACGPGEPLEFQGSSWHGSHVGGIATAQANNNQGIAGVAYDAKLLPVRALGMCGGMSSDIADSITWASGGTVPGVAANKNPAKVINLSLGGTSRTCPRVYQDAIDQATQRGAVVVVAAGNESRDASNSTPANCNNVIVVGSTGPKASQSYFSNFGSGVTISAPGGDNRQGGTILSTVDSGRTTPQGATYGNQQGTSQASPHVAGGVALLKQLKPDLTVAQAKKYLTDHATKLASCSGGCGAGVMDIGASVAALAKDTGNGSPAPSPTATPTVAPTATPTATPTTTPTTRPTASPSPTGNPSERKSITMTPSKVAKGEQVRIVVKGFRPGEKVTFLVDSSNYQLSTVTANSAGEINARWTVPYDLYRGNHTLYAVSRTDGSNVGTWFTIV